MVQPACQVPVCWACSLIMSRLEGTRAQLASYDIICTGATLPQRYRKQLLLQMVLPVEPLPKLHFTGRCGRCPPGSGVITIAVRYVFLLIVY